MNSAVAAVQKKNEPTPGDIGVGSRPGRCGEAWGLDQSLTLNRLLLSARSRFTGPDGPRRPCARTLMISC
jgi:hypothetical protein